MKLYDTIPRRQSVRKYLPDSLPAEQLKQIVEFTKNIRPLHPEITTCIELVNASEIKGLISAKAPNYLLIYSERKEGYLPNTGFMLQQVDLFLSSIGLGCCWQGMTKATIPIKDGLEYIIMLAFGKTQNNPHRIDKSEFKRKTLSEISTGHDSRLEAVRLAPSAMNSQPWFFVCNNDCIYVYRKKLGILKAAMYETMNQIDMGIALCHLWLASEHLELPFSFSSELQRIPQIAGYVPIGKVQ